MLAKEESLFPTIYANLRKALVPLMDDDAYWAMKKTLAEVKDGVAPRVSPYVQISNCDGDDSMFGEGGGITGCDEC